MFQYFVLPTQLFMTWIYYDHNYYYKYVQCSADASGTAVQKEDLDPIYGRIGDLMKHMEDLKQTFCTTMKEKDKVNAKLHDENVENIKWINETETQLELLKRQNFRELEENLKKKENRATSTASQVQTEVCSNIA